VVEPGTEVLNFIVFIPMFAKIDVGTNSISKL